MCIIEHGYPQCGRLNILWVFWYWYFDINVLRLSSASLAQVFGKADFGAAWCEPNLHSHWDFSLSAYQNTSCPSRHTLASLLLDDVIFVLRILIDTSYTTLLSLAMAAGKIRASWLRTAAKMCQIRYSNIPLIIVALFQRFSGNLPTKTYSRYQEVYINDLPV